MTDPLTISPQWMIKRCPLRDRRSASTRHQPDKRAWRSLRGRAGRVRNRPVAAGTRPTRPRPPRRNRLRVAYRNASDSTSRAVNVAANASRSSASRTVASDTARSSMSHAAARASSASQRASKNPARDPPSHSTPSPAMHRTRLDLYRCFRLRHSRPRSTGATRDGGRQRRSARSAGATVRSRPASTSRRYVPRLNLLLRPPAQQRRRGQRHHLTSWPGRSRCSRVRRCSGGRPRASTRGLHLAAMHQVARPVAPRRGSAAPPSADAGSSPPRKPGPAAVGDVLSPGIAGA